MKVSEFKNLSDHCQMLTRPQAAAYLGVAHQTLCNWAVTNSQLLPFVRIGRLVRYRRADLDAFIKAHLVNSAAAVED